MKVSGCCAQAQGDQDNKASFLQEKMEQREKEGSRQAKVILERVLVKHHEERENIFDRCPTNPAKCIPAMSPRRRSPPRRRSAGGGGGGGGGLGGFLGGATDWASQALGQLQAGLPDCTVTPPKFELKKDNMEVSLFKADCTLIAGGKEIKLFSLDFSNLIKVPWPEPLGTIFKSISAVTSLVKLGENLVSCATTSATDVVKCLGNSIIANVPPFSQLTQLGDVLLKCDTTSGTDTVKCLGNSIITNVPPFSQLTQLGDVLLKCDTTSGTDTVKCLGNGIITNVPPFSHLTNLGDILVSCAATSTTDIAKCLGNSIINNVPPFSQLTKLGDILGDFLGGFAKVAGTVAGHVLKGGSSLIQEAALSKFPAVGASPVVHHSGHSLVIKTHSRKNQMKAKMSTLQMRGDDDPPNDGISFNLHDEGSNYQSKLVTQFQGYEKDTSSCLAFAPKSKHGTNGQATEADWQVQTEDTFVALEPWAVPCGNDWMKRNWNKWQGYSFYMGESAIERCMTVTYGINVQPVVAFVGGVQFDVMPEPLASVDTTVCWPDGRPDGQDLSLLRTEIKSSGVLLFGRSLRLSKRFGSPTDFEGEHTHASMGTWQGSTNPQQEISRTKLLQTSQNETRQTASGVRDEGVLEWMEEEDFYLASANYSDLGMNLTSELRGAAAAKHLSLTATRAQGGFQLFHFNFAKTGMVNFQLKALLDGTSLELRTQLGFTDLFKSEERKLKLVDIVEQFAAVLHALPFVAPISRDRALNALKDFATKDVPAPPPPIVLRPGSTVYIYNHFFQRYLNIGPHTHMARAGGKDDRARWTVVDAGDGEIALHNQQTGRFLMMSDADIWGHPAAASHLHRSWSSTRFTVVPSPVSGRFGLYNKHVSRFVSVGPGDANVSPEIQAKDFPAGWTHQRFEFIVSDPYLKPGTKVGLYSHHKSWLRMHNNYMDTAAHVGLTPAIFQAHAATYTWETFEVVDAGSGEIALYSPKWVRFVGVTSDGKTHSTDHKAAHELPADWTSERFAVVPLGNGLIGLHNPQHNRFLRATPHGGCDASEPKSPADMPDWWTWERWQVVELPGSSTPTSSATLPNGWDFGAAR
ncbi:unnamed protein product [Symbiodinium sp. CCMP2592]|nr:unnamed protein product [Symbiodinium sp. CCMP2592]